MKDTDPFKPSRPISGFKTGALGMGHVVLHVKDFNKVVPFYRDLLGFKISDYSNTPISLCFFHIFELAIINAAVSPIIPLYLPHIWVNDFDPFTRCQFFTPVKRFNFFVHPSN